MSYDPFTLRSIFRLGVRADDLNGYLRDLAGARPSTESSSNLVVIGRSPSVPNKPAVQHSIRRETHPFSWEVVLSDSLKPFVLDTGCEEEP